MKRVVAVGGVVTGELQSVAWVTTELQPDATKTGEVPIPHWTYPQVRVAALRAAFEAVADGPDNDLFYAERMRRWHEEKEKR